MPASQECVWQEPLSQSALRLVSASNFALRVWEDASSRQKERHGSPHRVKGVAHPSPKAPQHKQPPRSPVPPPTRRESSEPGAAAPGQVLLRRSPPTRLRMNPQPAEPGARSEALPAASVPEGARERESSRARPKKNFARLGLKEETAAVVASVGPQSAATLSLCRAPEPSAPQRRILRLAPGAPTPVSSGELIRPIMPVPPSHSASSLQTLGHPRIQSPPTERPGPQRTPPTGAAGDPKSALPAATSSLPPSVPAVSSGREEGDAGGARARRRPGDTGATSSGAAALAEPPSRGRPWWSEEAAAAEDWPGGRGRC